MPSDTAILAASLTGFFGALIVFVVGARFTRDLRALACGGIFSGAALAAIVYVLWGWFTHGVIWAQAGMLPLAALIVLLVMTAQNWFVFYQDRRDVLQSSRPALVMLSAAFLAALVRILAGRHSVLLPLIGAGAASLAILSCIDPVQRSIERTHSVMAGTLVGIGKVLIPFTGIVIFLKPEGAAQPDPAAGAADAIGENWFATNLIALFWDMGQIALLILMNGTRIAHRAAAFDPLGIPGQTKDGQSITGEMSRLKRDSVVLIFVLALHVLCGVVIAKAG